MEDSLKPIGWIGSSKKDLSEMPADTQRTIGYALYQAQRGGKPLNAKTLAGFGDAGVLEVIANTDGDTFRAIYTIRFAKIIYVLHCFQKKSKSGSETPRLEMALVQRRLRTAADEYQKWLKNQ